MVEGLADPLALELHHVLLQEFLEFKLEPILKVLVGRSHLAKLLKINLSEFEPTIYGPQVEVGVGLEESNGVDLLKGRRLSLVLRVHECSIHVIERSMGGNLLLRLCPNLVSYFGLILIIHFVKHIGLKLLEDNGKGAHELDLFSYSIHLPLPVASNVCFLAHPVQSLLLHLEESPLARALGNCVRDLTAIVRLESNVILGVLVQPKLPLLLVHLLELALSQLDLHLGCSSAPTTNLFVWVLIDMEILDGRAHPGLI